MEAAKHEIRMNTKSAYVVRVFVKLAVEAFILLAALTFFADESYFLSACIPLIAMTLIVSVPILWTSRESSKNFNISFAGAGLIIFLTAQFLLDIPWWFTLLVLFLMHWRMSTHLIEEKESRFDVSGGFMLGFMLLTIISYGFQGIYQRQPSEIILIVFVIGLLVISGGTFLVRLAESAEHSEKSTRVSSAKLPVLFFGVIAGLIAIFALLNETLNKGLGFLIKGFFFLLSLLIDPIWKLINWIIGLFPGDAGEDIKVPKFRGEGSEEKYSQEEITQGAELSFAWWNEALIGLLILIILIYVWRRYKDKGSMDEEAAKTYAGFSSFRESIASDKETKMENADYSRADSEIRKSIFSLENKAAARGLSRMNGETLQEWFQRLGLQEKTEFYRLYEEVRYGNKKVPEEKEKWFKQSVERLERKMVEGNTV